MTQKLCPTSKLILWHRKLRVDNSMTSNVQKSNRSSIRFTLWSFDRQSLRKSAIAALIVSSVSLAGCQQMGFRARDDELSKMMAEQDDWALPASTLGKVPRPNSYDLKTLSRKEKASRSQADVGHGSVDRGSNKKQAGLVGYGPDDDSADLADRTLSSLLSTSHQDIDFDGAIASLPAKYRDILKQQLDAVQRQDGIATIALPKSRSLTNEIRASSEDNGQVSHDSHVSSDTQIAPKGNGSTKVSFRMTDSSVVERDTKVAADSQQVKNLDTGVVTAIATAGPVVDHTDTSTNNVVLASAIAPLRDTKLLPTAQMKSENTVQGASPSNWRQLLNQAIEQLEKQIKEVPASDENLRISQEVTLRMLYVSQRRLSDALRPIDKLSENERDYFQHQMQALYEASNPDAMPVRSRHWSLVMNSQREATNHLAAASNLEVKSMAFCTEVERYGVITKFPKYHFKPDDELLLYCEIENVAANKVKEGFESQLQGSYEVIDSQGRKVADQLLPMEPEICQNHRRDYFIVYKIYMPQQISAGNYQLRLTVEDMKAHKFGQSQLDFQIKR